MVVRKISYYRVIVSLCLFMFLLSPVFGDENSAVSFDKELSENNIVMIQPILCVFFITRLQDGCSMQVWEWMLQIFGHSMTICIFLNWDTMLV